MLKIRIKATARAPHQYETAKALQAGFAIHGETDVKIVDCLYESCDLLVTWGTRGLQSIPKNLYRDVLVMERSYLHDRFVDISLGFNGLNGRADFCHDNPSITGKRFSEKYSDQLHPWKENQDKKIILLATQCLGDMSLVHCRPNALAVYKDVCRMIRRFCERHHGFHGMVRHHPQKPLRSPVFARLRESSHLIPIDEVLKAVYAVVTINSNFGVDSLLRGVPVVNIDEGAMTWNVASHHSISSDIWSNLPDRTPWAEKLAYCQWNLSEIASGEAWNHLKYKYNRNGTTSTNPH
jgi:hypothetical protein